MRHGPQMTAITGYMRYFTGWGTNDNAIVMSKIIIIKYFLLRIAYLPIHLIGTVIGQARGYPSHAPVGWLFLRHSSFHQGVWGAVH